MLNLIQDSFFVGSGSGAAMSAGRARSTAMVSSRAMDVIPLSRVLRSTGLVAQSSGIVIAAVSTNGILCLVDNRARVVARV
jgi:hypothetical protein